MENEIKNNNIENNSSENNDTEQSNNENNNANKNNLTKIDKIRLLEEAKMYSQSQMRISEKKSPNKFLMYIILFILLIFLFYSIAIFLRHYMFLKMGL